MSENELLGAAEDLYCESFDAEAEATARLQVTKKNKLSK